MRFCRHFRRGGVWLQIETIPTSEGAAAKTTEIYHKLNFLLGSWTKISNKCLRDRASPLCCHSALIRLCTMSSPNSPVSHIRYRMRVKAVFLRILTVQMSTTGLSRLPSAINVLTNRPMLFCALASISSIISFTPSAMMEKLGQARPRRRTQQQPQHRCRSM